MPSPRMPDRDIPVIAASSLNVSPFRNRMAVSVWLKASCTVPSLRTSLAAKRSICSYALVLAENCSEGAPPAGNGLIPLSDEGYGENA